VRSTFLDLYFIKICVWQKGKLYRDLIFHDTCAAHFHLYAILGYIKKSNIIIFELSYKVNLQIVCKKSNLWTIYIENI